MRSVKAPPFLPSATAFAVLFFTGCQNPRQARIEQNAALFVSLPEPAQALIREGLVEAGFTADMVYMALGKPNRTQSGEAKEGQMATWTYKNFVLSDTIAMKIGMNNPGSRYQPGRLLSPNAPGGPSLSSTRNVGPQPGVSDMSDATVGTLYVEFLNDRVFNLRLER